MTDTATSQQIFAKVGPGRLVLVVGPSGAGKDTLIDLARAACAEDDGVVFARRIVTRAASAAEDNDHMTPDAFHQAQRRGDFLMDWEAHGLSYALPRTIDHDLRAGHTVVANVSRTVIDALRQSYVNVVVVAVTASPDILAARIAARGRSSDGTVADRLRREVVAPRADVTIDNINSAEEHAGELVRVIKHS